MFNISKIHRLSLEQLTFGTNGDELDPLAGDKVQRLVDVGNLVEPHLAPENKMRGNGEKEAELCT